MKFPFRIQKPWNIPRELERAFSAKSIEETLSLFNRVGKTNFFVFDYYRQKIISGYSSIDTLTGYSKELIGKEGLAVYTRIFDAQSMDWLHQMTDELLKVFAEYPLHERKDLQFTFELAGKTSRHADILLHHKVIPYQLCKNGNLWMGLCHISASPFVQVQPRATITDTKTGKRYDFIDGVFRLSPNSVLTQEELNILRWMTQDYSAREICQEMNVTENVLKRKKKKMYDKLGVKSAAGAGYRAQFMELL